MSMADMCYDIGLDNYINGDDYLYSRRGNYRRRSKPNPQLSVPEGYWRTGDGQTIAIKDMTTRHLNNTIRFLRRQIDGSAHDDFCWDNINAMENELKRRNQ